MNRLQTGHLGQVAVTLPLTLVTTFWVVLGEPVIKACHHRVG